MRVSKEFVHTAVTAVVLCTLLLSLSGCEQIITRELTELRYNKGRVEALARNYIKKKYSFVPDFEAVKSEYSYGAEGPAEFIGYILHSSKGFYVKAMVDPEDGVSFSDTYQFEEIQEALRALIQQRGVFSEYPLYLPTQEVDENIRWWRLSEVAFQEYFDGNLEGFFEQGQKIQLYLREQADLTFPTFREEIDFLSDYLGGQVNAISFRDRFYSALQTALSSGDANVLDYLNGRSRPLAECYNQGMVRYTYSSRDWCINNLQQLEPGLWVGLASGYDSSYLQELEDTVANFTPAELTVVHTDPSENDHFSEDGYRAVSDGYRISTGPDSPYHDPWLTIGIDVKTFTGLDLSPEDVFVGVVNYKEDAVSHYPGSYYRSDDTITPENIRDTNSLYNAYLENGWLYFTIRPNKADATYQEGVFLMIADSNLKAE